MIGGRACGADGQGRGQSRPRATPTPQCRCCKGLRSIMCGFLRQERSRLQGGEGTCPGFLAQQQLGMGGAPGPRTRARCCGAFVPELRALAPGSRAREESRRGRGRLGPGLLARSALPSPGVRGPEGAVRSQGSDQPQANRRTHRSRPARHRRPKDPGKLARPFAPDNCPGFGVCAAPPCGPGEALQKWQRA